VDGGAPARGYEKRGIGSRYRDWRGRRHGLSGAGADAGAQVRMWGEHAGIVMHMAPWQWYRRGEPVEQLERVEGEFGLAAGQGIGQGVTDRLVGSVPGEPLAGESGAGAVAQTCL